MTRISVHFTEQTWQNLRAVFASRGYFIHATTMIGRYTVTTIQSELPCCNIFPDEWGVSFQPGEQSNCCEHCKAILIRETARF